MKKILILLILSTIIEAKPNMVKAKLIEKISNLLLPNKNISMYIKDSNYIEIKDELKHKHINIVSDCKNANFIIIKNFKQLSNKCDKEHKIIFTTSYKAYKNTKYVTGAIFWQKGRLNLIFRSNKLKDLSIKLPKFYNKYIE